MIIDWERNCKLILQSKKYSTHNNITKEQICLIRYLRDLGKSRDEIFNIWKETDSPYIIGACDSEDITDGFEFLWGQSEKYKPVVTPSTGLTQREIDYINGLNVEMFFKTTVAALIMYCRAYGQENKMLCDMDLFRYIVKKALHSREITERQWNKMAEWNNRDGIYEVSEFVDEQETVKKVRFIILHMDMEGDLVFVIDSFEDFAKVEPMLKPPTQTCAICGNPFIITARTRRALCDLCYHQKRNDGRHKDRLGADKSKS